MASLKNLTQNVTLASDVEVAKTFWHRTIGLMGRKVLQSDKVIWIHRCNSIHTCFVRFAIDVVFVDANLCVKAKYENLNPWRVTKLVWGAKSVFELPAGKAQQVKIGDQLYVGN